MNEFIRTNSVSQEETISLPHNIEAEQALLGALLVNNEVHDHVSPQIITEKHFFDPVHARIFKIASEFISTQGRLVSPVTLKSYMEEDEGLKALGGGQYLVRLAGMAVPIFAAKEHAQLIRDLSIRRTLISIGEETIEKAQRIAQSSDPKEQIVEAEQQLYQPRGVLFGA